MSKLTREDVLHIAKLSRLELPDEQVEQFSNQLSEVLEYVEKLSEINTEGVEETSQVTGLVNQTRTDEQKVFERKQDLVEQAPDSEDNQIKVPKVL